MEVLCPRRTSRSELKIQYKPRFLPYRPSFWLKEIFTIISGVGVVFWHAIIVFAFEQFLLLMIVVLFQL